MDIGPHTRDNAAMGSATRSRTVLLVVGSLVGLLVAVAVVLALQPPPVFDASTPEGAAQGYYQALLDGDEELAATYMTEELQQACDGGFWYYDRRKDARIVIVRSVVDGDSAELDVRIEIAYGGGPFGGGSYDQEESVELERHGDRWLISQATWPMDRYACEKDL